MLTTLVTTYFLGLLWYRFSDSWQKTLIPDEPEERYWVVFFGLRAAKMDLFEYPSETALSGEFVPGGSLEITNDESVDGRRMFGGKEYGINNDLPLNQIHQRLITCMYYALTTLSTVGYGDFFPKSIAEKIVGSII